MTEYVLTTATIKMIREDADLYAAVSKALDKAPAYLAVLLRKNDKQLTKIEVLKVIANHTGKTTDELIEEYTEVDETSTKVESVSE